MASSWQEYKKKHGIETEKIEKKQSAQNQEPEQKESAWQRYKRENGTPDSNPYLRVEIQGRNQQRQKLQEQKKYINNFVGPTMPGQADAMEAAYYREQAALGAKWKSADDYRREQNFYRNALQRATAGYNAELSRREQERQAEEEKLSGLYTALKRDGDLVSNIRYMAMLDRYSKDGAFLQQMGTDAARMGSYGLYDRANKANQGALNSIAGAYSDYRKEADKSFNAKLEHLKTEDPESYLAYTSTAEDVEKKLTELEQQKAEMEGVYRHYYDEWANDSTSKSAEEHEAKEKAFLDFEAKLNQVNADIEVYKKAQRYHKNQKGKALYEQYLGGGKVLDPETFKKIDAGKARYEADRQAAIAKGGETLDYGLNLIAKARGVWRGDKDRLEEAGWDPTFDTAANLTSEDENTFYALYADDPQKAMDFITYANNRRNEEYEGWMAEWAHEDGWNATGAFFQALGNRIGSGAVNLVDPHSAAANQLARTGSGLLSGGSQLLNEWSGTFDTDIPILRDLINGKGLGDFYQLANSVLESGINAYVARKLGAYIPGDGTDGIAALGTMIMGSSASAADYNECIKRGLTPGEAQKHALAAGINEALFEFVSMDKLIDTEKLMMADTMKDKIKAIFIQSGVEASEEFCTTVANRLADGAQARRDGYDSQIEHRAKELIALGKSRDEALEMAEKEWLTELINDAIGGFISGGLHDAGALVATAPMRAVSYVRGERAANQAAGATSTNEQQAAMRAYAADNGIAWNSTENAATVQNTQTETEGTDSSPAAQNDNEGQQTQEQPKPRQEKRQERREEKAQAKSEREIGADVRRVQEHIDKQFAGKSVQEQTAIRDKLVQQYGEAIAPAVYSAIRTNAYQQAAQNANPTAIQAAKEAALEGVSDPDMRKVVSSAYDQAAVELAVKTKNTDALGRYYQQIRNTGTGNMTMEAIVKGEDGQETRSAITGMSEDGKSVTLSDGSTVAVKDLQADADTMDIIHEISALGLGKNTDKVFQAYKKSGKTGLDGYRWIMDYTTAIDQGRNRRISLQEAIKRSSLDAETVMEAYEMGHKETMDETRKAVQKNENRPKRKGVTGRVANIDTSAIQNEPMSKQEREQFDLANQIFELLGVDVKWESSKTRNGKYVGANGSYLGGVITLDIHAGRNDVIRDINSGILATTGHELTHFLQEYAPEQYQALKEFVLQQIVKNSKYGEATLERMIQDKQRRSKNELSKPRAEDEVVADACQTMLRDSKALREFAEKKPGAAKEMIRWLADWFKKIKAAFSRSAQLSEQARFMEKMEKDVREAFGKLWDDALREAVRVHDEIGNMESPATEGGEQYSIREQDGFWYVQADRNVLTGNDPVQWGKQIENYINEKIRKGEDVIFPTKDGHLLILTGRSAYKLSDRHVSSIAKAAEAFLTDQQYAVKGNAAVHIDELIQVARFREYKEDVDGKHKNDVGEDGFNYFDAYFMNADGQYYLIPLSAGINENDETAYSVGNPKRRRFPNRAGSSSKTEALKNGGKPSVNNDSTNQPNRQEVKTAIQIAYEKALQEKAQNSDRDYLSAVESGDMETAQRMVDEAAKEAGYDIKAYHGTPKKFNVFSKDRIGSTTDYGWFGKGFYFTDKQDVASVYAGYLNDSNVIEAYLNVQNPFDFNEYPGAEDKTAGQIMEEVMGKKYGRRGELTEDDKAQRSEDFTNWLRENGYDGVRAWSQIMILDSEQAKRTDPVTYDDSGKVIPLSERFNPENEDIRYSEREDAKPKSAQAQRDAGYKLSESKFYSLYSAHKLNMTGRGNVQEQIASIMADGFKGDGGFGNNVMPTNISYDVDENGKRIPRGLSAQKYAPKKGEYILLVPKEGIEVKGSRYNFTERVKPGYKPAFDYEIVQADYDGQPYYEMYSKAYDEAQNKKGRQYSERDYDTPSDLDLMEQAAEEWDEGRWNELLKDEAGDVRERLETAAKSERKARELQRKFEKLQADIQSFEGEGASRIAVKDFTRNVLDSFGIPSGQRTEVGQLLQSLTDYLLAGNHVNRADILPIFEGLVQSGKRQLAADDALANIREDLKGRRIYVDKTVREEFGDDYEAFRRRAFGLGITLTGRNTDTGIDTVNAELADTYPGSFDASETDLKAALENIVDTAESGKTSTVSLLEALAEEERTTGTPVREQLQDMLDQFTRQIEIFEDRARLERKARAGDAAEIAKLKSKAHEAANKLSEMRKERDALRRKVKNADNAQQKAVDDALRKLVVRDAKQLAEAVRQKQELAKKLADQIEREKQIVSGALKPLAMQRLLNAARDHAYEAGVEHKEEVFKRYKERQEITKLRTRIKNLSNEMKRRMTNPSERVYVPASLYESMARLADVLDEALSPKPGTTAEAKYKAVMYAIHRMSKEYEAVQKLDDPVYSSEYEKETQDAIDKIEELFERKDATWISELTGDTTKTFKELDFGELRQLYELMQQINYAMVNASVLLRHSEFKNVYAAMDAVAKQQREIKPLNEIGKHEAGKRERILNKLSTMRAVEMMSGWNRESALYQLMRGIEQGTMDANAWVMFYDKTMQPLKTGKNELEYRQAVSKKMDYGATDERGNKVLMTKMQALQILMTAEREAHNDKLVHLQRGGAVIRDLKAKRNYRINVTPDLLQKIQNSLTEWDKSYMKTVRDYFQREGKRTNEILYKMRHKVLPTEDYYTPYYVDKDYLETKLDQPEVAMQMWNKTPRSINALTENASQPVYIDGMDTVMNQHVKEISNYIGLALAIRDFAKVYNGMIRQGDGEKPLPVKQTINDNFESGSKLLTQAVIDVQGGRKPKEHRTRIGKTLEKLQSAFYRKSLLINMGVTIKQAASYVAAESILDHRAIIAGNRPVFVGADKSHSPSLIAHLFMTPSGKTAQRIFNEIDEHTPLHWLRRQGMSMQELAEASASDGTIKNKLGMLGARMEQSKIGHAARMVTESLDPLNWIQRMDVATTAALWVACKEQATLDGMKAGTAEYWNHVTELYERVITETQPMYDTLHRSEDQKDRNGLMQYLFPFRTVPIQNHGQLVASYETLLAARKSGDKARIEAATRFARKTAVAQAMSAAIFATFTLFAQAMKRKTKKYRDEDEELTLGSLGLGVSKDVVGTLFSVFFPMYGSMVWDSVNTGIDYAKTGKNAFSYNSFSIGVVDMLNDIQKNGSDLAKDMIDLFAGREVDKDKTISHIGKLLTSGLECFGWPTKTAESYWNGIKGNVEDLANGRIPALNDETWERATAVNANRFFKAWSAGDAEKMQTVLDEVEASGKSEDSISSAFNSAAKDAYEAGEISLEEYADYLEKTGMFDGEKISGKIKTILKAEFTAGSRGEDETIDALITYCGMDEDKAWETVQKWEGNAEHPDDEDYSWSKYDDLRAAIDANQDISGIVAELTEHGTKDADIKDAAKKHITAQFVDGKISEDKFKNWLARYCGITNREDAAEIVNDAKCKRETGYTVEKLGEGYRAGDVGKTDAKTALTRYGGLTGTDADKKIRWWDQQKLHPDLEISESACNSWYDGSSKTRENGHESAKAAGMSLQAYLAAKKELDKISDANGNSTGEDEYIAALAKMNLTPRQKDALYYEKYKGGTRKGIYKTW